MTLSFIATIDTTTNEVLTITLDLKSFIEDMAKKQLEKEKDSMSQLEWYCTQKVGQNIKLFLFSILNFKVSKFYYF